MKKFIKINYLIDNFIPFFILYWSIQFIFITFLKNKTSDILDYKRWFIISIMVLLIIYPVYFFIKKNKEIKTIISIILIPLKIVLIVYLFSFVVSFTNYLIIKDNSIKISIPSEINFKNYKLLLKHTSEFNTKKKELEKMKNESVSELYSNRNKKEKAERIDIGEYKKIAEDYSKRIKDLIENNFFYNDYTKINLEYNLTGYLDYSKIVIMELEGYQKKEDFKLLNKLLNNYMKQIILLMKMKEISLVDAITLNRSIDELAKYLQKNKNLDLDLENNFNTIILEQKKIFKKAFGFESRFISEIGFKKYEKYELVFIPFFNMRRTKYLANKYFITVINNYNLENINNLDMKINIFDYVINPIGSLVIQIALPIEPSYNFKETEKLLLEIKDERKIKVD